MKCIVWLWNPGWEYKNTRHNAGYFIVELLAQMWKFPEFEASKFFGVISEGIIQGEKVILLKPTTYMNISGKSVSAILHFYKIPPSDLLVISDDIDMEFAKVRVRTSGSSGWQNWLKSIIEFLGTDIFTRIKIGIWRDPKLDVSSWVLSKFKEDEIRELTQVFGEKIEPGIQRWVYSDEMN